MSNRELAKNLIDQIPESKMYYILAYLQGAAVPEEVPNEETIAATYARCKILYQVQERL